MREIKFRAWHSGEKVMAPWHQMIDDHWDLSELNRRTVMQYTGLKDKNGKDIYEGDIINCADEYDETRRRLGVVRYGQGCYDSGFYRFQGFYVERQGHYENDSWTWESTDEDGTANVLMKDKPFCEVIGNIYENPELL